MTLIHSSLSNLAAAVGDEGAKALHLAAEESIGAMARTCQDEGINADLQPNGLLVASTSPLQDDLIRRDVDTAQRLGVHGFSYLEKDEIQAAVHSETFRCGLREEACTLLNPARLVHGLRDAVVRAGGRVYDETPTASMEETGQAVRVRTPKGEITADRLVLAANAYSAQISALRRNVMPFYSYILLSAPLTGEQWSRVGWQGREGVEDRRTYLHYFRPTIDGRILWGGRDAPYHGNGPHPRYDRDEHVFRRLEESFAFTFPQLRDVRFEHRWGGPIGITGEFLPLVGWLKPGRIAYAFGYQGHGVAISNLTSRIVRDLLLDRDTELTRLAIVNRRRVDLGPRLLRDPMVHAMQRFGLRRDDAGVEMKPPALLRIMGRLTGRGGPG
jgi:glycine/D-amino acid oxidase-like deaminating enzyme